MDFAAGEYLSSYTLSELLYIYREISNQYSCKYSFYSIMRCFSELREQGSILTMYNVKLQDHGMYGNLYTPPFRIAPDETQLFVE